MERSIRVNVVSSAVVLAAALVVSVITSTVLAARAYESGRRFSAGAARQITVRGSARERTRADLAVWRVRVAADGPTLADAYGALDRREARLRDFLAGASIPPAEISLDAIETREYEKRDKDGNLTGETAKYTLNRSLVIRSPEVERIARAAERVTILLKENVPVISDPPAYSCTKLAEIRLRVLEEATRDARSRADLIAKNANCQIGAVLDARSGVIQVTRPDSTEVSDYGSYDTSTIEKDVSVVVTLALNISPSPQP